MDQNELRVNEILETGSLKELDSLTLSDKVSIVHELGIKVTPNQNQMDNVFKFMNNSVKTASERYTVGESFLESLTANNEESHDCLILLLNCPENEIIYY